MNSDARCTARAVERDRALVDVKSSAHDRCRRMMLLYVRSCGGAERAREWKICEKQLDLSREVVGFVHKLRALDLFKLPGVAETIDWAEALLQLDAVALDPGIIDSTLGVLLKYQDDIARLQGSEAMKLLDAVRAEIAENPLG